MDMNQPIGTTPLDRADGLVGRPIDRIDGRLKVTGKAPYAYEIRDLAKPAYGFIVEASIAKGSIRRLDTQAARRAPGVLLVMTHENVPEQGEKKEQVFPQLQGTEIRFRGQPIAFVVAESFEQARAAAALVKADYAVQTPQASLRDAKPTAFEPKAMQTPPDSKLGDFDGAFAAAPVKLDVEYTTPVQIHAQMEPHATIASWESGPDGERVTLYTANQMLNRGQASLAQVLKLDPKNVRLISHYIGGGFGSKLQPQPEATLAALASRSLRRPVKAAMTRQQEFHVATHRSDTIQRIRLGAPARSTRRRTASPGTGSPT
jgi:xanthine dehydrogenase YagR molybdenum-binding subunit